MNRFVLMGLAAFGLLAGVLVSTGTAVASDAAALLPFGRQMTTAAASEPIIAGGVALAIGDVNHRVAAGGRLGLSYRGPLAAGWSLHAGLAAAFAARAQAEHSQFGHLRFAVRRQMDKFHLQGGSLFWAGDGIADWARSASPFGLAGWRSSLLRVEALVLWDRSDELGRRRSPANWADGAAPGVVPGLTLGTRLGPLDAVLGYRASIRNRMLAADLVTLALRVPRTVAVGRVVPFVAADQPVAAGRGRQRIAVEFGVRIDLKVKATRTAVLPDDAPKPAAPFDPFG